jgi:hypothetical protein
MTLAGTFKNGVVVFDTAPELPDGTRVEVVIPHSQGSAATTKSTLHDLLQFAGTCNDLPADFAEQHDHYIHGTPRR